MKITSATYISSHPRQDLCPTDGRPEYAFIGRSNVGKSSLINALTQRRNLALTSSTPGKTMCINHFLINEQWYLVDLPGYGYAQRGLKEREKLKNMIIHYVLDREPLICLFVLIDIRHDPQKVDLAFLHFLGSNGVPFAIVFTKADKLSPNKVKPAAKKYLETLKEEWEELPPFFITSATNKLGREELLDYIDHINKNL
ncbi:MAG: YihA family ribosome biogenesis GTP-binding protein [Bacteroidaceae bacterium]|nr:YihA family ribosome biogenesis GTP-binding protein [Bacteroidaceae bacterium]